MGLNKREQAFLRRLHPDLFPVIKKSRPRKKLAPTGMAGLKVGRNILMIDNENVKPGGKDELELSRY